MDKRRGRTSQEEEQAAKETEQAMARERLGRIERAYEIIQRVTGESLRDIDLGDERNLTHWRSASKRDKTLAGMVETLIKSLEVYSAALYSNTMDPETQAQYDSTRLQIENLQKLLDNA